MSQVSINSLRYRRERGAISVAFILMIVLLLGFVGLAVDSGRLFVSKTELQNAADSCALAAAAALTGANTEQLKQAENWGITAGTRNLVGMQASAVSIPADSAVTFSRTLNGSYATKSAISGADALQMQFARCRVTEAGIQTLLIQVLNALPGVSIGPGTARAEAVATLSPSVSNCALPLAVCRRSPGPAGSDANGYVVGEWIQGLQDPGQSWKGGYKWVEFPGYARVKDLEALLRGSGQCDLNAANKVDSRPGIDNSLVDAWNSRFGVWKGSGLDGTPDLTGFAYVDFGTSPNWAVGSNAFDDFKSKRATFTPWNNKPALGGGWKPSATEAHSKGGDRRLVVGPVINCPGLAQNGQNLPILDWACYLMLHPVSNPTDPWKIEYRGSASDIKSGCVSSGLPGGPGAGGPKVPTLVQ